MKLMLQVPEAHAGRFLSIETPWGRRTKMGPWQGGGVFRGETSPMLAFFQKAETVNGLRVRVGLPERVERGTKAVAITVTCENAGPTAMAGRRPGCWLLWGGFDTPWRRVCRKDVPLPKEWERVEPGQTVRATLDLDAPAVAGDYSVFVVFSYSEPSEGAKRAPAGSYSNSALLRVR